MLLNQLDLNKTEEFADITLKKGADGWRGIIGEGFSPESVTRLILSAGAELRETFGDGNILICHDGRFYSEKTARAAANSLVNVGHQIIFGGMLPTPVATFTVRDRSYIGAILITASHNPFYWNGVKLKVSPGMPPSKQFESAVELRRKSLPIKAVSAGSIQEIMPSIFIDKYIADLLGAIGQSAIDLIRHNNLNIVVDGLHGISGELFDNAFKLAGCRSTRLDLSVDPLFCGIQPDPMNVKSRQRIADYTQKHGNIDIAFVTDGDGDRLCVLDGKGNFIWPHDVLALLMQELHQIDSTPGCIITTTPTGSIVNRMAKHLERPTREVSVGFKHAAPYLKTGDALLAGGAVGEFGYRSHGYDRDPLVGAFLLLGLICKTGKSIQEIVLNMHNKFGHSFYKQWTLELSNAGHQDIQQFSKDILKRANLTSKITHMSEVDGTKHYLGNTAWLLVRNATTENGIRIYAETENEEDLKSLERAFS